MDLAQFGQLQPRCEVEWQGHAVLYATPNRATRWLAETLFSKEPVTIAWRSRLGASAQLADVGANVGMYSSIARSWASSRAWAPLEPGAGRRGHASPWSVQGDGRGCL